MSDLIYEIYRAAGDKDHWQNALAAITGFLDAQMDFSRVPAVWIRALSSTFQFSTGSINPHSSYQEHFVALDTQMHRVAQATCGIIKANFDLSCAYLQRTSGYDTPEIIDWKNNRFAM